MFDIARQSKGTILLTSCNLKACYDCVVHTQAMLACRSLGIPEESLHSLFATLQEILYQTQKNYGKSSQSFGGFEKEFTCNPQGAEQGNGTAAQPWTVVSTNMFEILHLLGLSNVMSSPISGTDLVLVGFAYVDNSDL